MKVVKRILILCLAIFLNFSFISLIGQNNGAIITVADGCPECDSLLFDVTCVNIDPTSGLASITANDIGIDPNNPIHNDPNIIGFGFMVNVFNSMGQKLNLNSLTDTYGGQTNFYHITNNVGPHYLFHFDPVLNIYVSSFQLEFFFGNSTSFKITLDIIPLMLYTPINSNNYGIIDTDLSGTIYTGCNDNRIGNRNVSESHNFEIIPNPTRNRFQVSLNKELNSQNRISIIDLSGRELYSKTNMLGRNIMFNNVKLSKGIYLLKIESSSYLSTKRLIIN